MSELFDYFKNLLNGPQPGHLPFVHEILERSETELESYLRWKLSDRFHETMGTLKQMISPLKENQFDGRGVTLIETPTIRGLVIQFDPGHFQTSEFSHLTDHFSESILDLRYKKYVSDVKSFVRKDFIEKLERHFLKPVIVRGSSKPFDQRFGNITIEHLLKDNQSVEMRLSCAVYSDRKYNQPRDFTQLLENLFNN